MFGMNASFTPPPPMFARPIAAAPTLPNSPFVQ